MSQAGPAPASKLVAELKVSGHLMTLEKGLFCVFHAPGSVSADPRTGLPGVRITLPPLGDRRRVSISSFNEDGWIGAEGSAALVRINEGPAQLLVTIYQNGAAQQEAPKLQVMRLGDVPEVAAAVPPAPPAEPEIAAEAPAAPASAELPPAPLEDPEVAAHVQRRGDLLGRLGDWMGEPGSQSWIEGFAIAPRHTLAVEDIEYQAVLGKGWLSPWSDGGQYCGSRGMALPILGLRVRLKGEAARRYRLNLHATFTDGSKAGPVSEEETAEAESLAPLEAFRIEVEPREAAQPAASPVAATHQAVGPAPVSEPPAARGAEPAKPVPSRRPAAAAAPAAKAPLKAVGGKAASRAPARSSRR